MEDSLVASGSGLSVTTRDVVMVDESGMCKPMSAYSSTHDFVDVSHVETSSPGGENLVLNVVRELIQVGDDVIRYGKCKHECLEAHRVPFRVDSSPYERFGALCRHVFGGYCVIGTVPDRGEGCEHVVRNWPVESNFAAEVCRALSALGGTADVAIDTLAAMCTEIFGRNVSIKEDVDAFSYRCWKCDHTINCWLSI